MSVEKLDVLDANGLDTMLEEVFQTVEDNYPRREEVNSKVYTGTKQDVLDDLDNIPDGAIIMTTDEDGDSIADNLADHSEAIMNLQNQMPHVRYTFTNTESLTRSQCLDSIYSILNSLNDIQLVGAKIASVMNAGHIVIYTINSRYSDRINASTMLSSDTTNIGIVELVIKESGSISMTYGTSSGSIGDHSSNTDIAAIYIYY